MPGDIEVVAAFDIDKRKVIKSMFDKRIFPDSWLNASSNSSLFFMIIMYPFQSYSKGLLAISGKVILKNQEYSFYWKGGGSQITALG